MRKCGLAIRSIFEITAACASICAGVSCVEAPPRSGATADAGSLFGEAAGVGAEKPRATATLEAKDAGPPVERVLPSEVQGAGARAGGAASASGRGAAGAAAADSGKDAAADSTHSPTGAADGGEALGVLPDQPGALVITELMVDPKQLRDADGEWFELWNPGDVPFDLAGCVLADGSAQPHAISMHRTIEPHAFVSVARTAQPGFDPDLTATFSLSNEADTLALICGDVTIDRVDYAKTAGFPLVAGAALSLEPAHSDAVENDRADAWCLAMSHYASDATDFGTPGRANPACTQDEDAGVFD